MRLVSFDRSGDIRAGILLELDENCTVVDLNDADRAIPPSMTELLAAGPEAMQLARRISQRSARALEIVQISRDHLVAPVPRPQKVIGVGLNYQDHAIESRIDPPKFPTFFGKFPNCVAGPFDVLDLPRTSSQVDYEGELGVVIGIRSSGVTTSDALEHVAGYVVVNDLSARDLQTRTSQWLSGKSFDSSAPMGPALVTRDEIPDPHNLRIRTTVSGSVRQDGNTRDLIFNIPELLAHLTAIMTLEAGDVIATGTPAGVGMAQTPPQFLEAGDIVRVEIGGLGFIENRMA